MSRFENKYDVVIIGGGLAGLCLARQLLLTSNKSILLLEKRPSLPPKNQKVGESTVQLGGYYLSKVLELEHSLLQNHYMKYNLRFHWKTAGKGNDLFEDYSQAYIRNFSNIASYQVNRNTLEEEILRENKSQKNFSIALEISKLETDIGPPHKISFETSQKHSVQADWIIDATGRQRFLTKKLKNASALPNRHGSSYLWVEGLLDIDKLPGTNNSQNRKSTTRQKTGHLPFWLATNHFMGDGFWFWVIPLRDRTSLGLVFDQSVIDHSSVNSPKKLVDWVSKEFPLFGKELSKRTILGGGGHKEVATNSDQVISPKQWATTGESSRFLDPLYSPGTDFIAIHNTLICHAINSPKTKLPKNCLLFESLMKAYFDAFVPTFSTSYKAIGDQECFVLKYTWELSVYFTFYVFPYINDFITDDKFLLPYLQKFSELGPINHNLHDFLSDYHQWKTNNLPKQTETHFHELTKLKPLQIAESLFYQVGIDNATAQNLLADHLKNLKSLSRFTLAYLSSVIANDPKLLTNASFVDGIDLTAFRFDPVRIKIEAKKAAATYKEYDWGFDPHVLAPFHFNTPAKKVA